MIYSATKRLIDVAAASIGLVLLAPLLLVLAVSVRYKLGSPIFFRQTRAGQHGRPFQLIKFRSMVDGDGSDAERLTPFGRWLRASSLDELPELWNILRGDMTLVGPRPLLVNYLPLYSDHQRRRHEVRPGLTGLAQVSGRNGLSWHDRLALDVDYVDNRSVWMDINILVRTVGVVINKNGISAEGEATATRFSGAPTATQPKTRGPMSRELYAAGGSSGHESRDSAAPAA